MCVYIYIYIQTCMTENRCIPNYGRQAVVEDNNLLKILISRTLSKITISKLSQGSCFIYIHILLIWIFNTHITHTHKYIYMYIYTPRQNIFLEREFCTTMHFSVRISMTVMFYGVGMCKDNMGFGFTGRWEMLPSGSTNVIFISSIFLFQFAIKMFQLMALDFWMLTRTFLDHKFCITPFEYLSVPVELPLSMGKNQSGGKHR